MKAKKKKIKPKQIRNKHSKEICTMLKNKGTKGINAKMINNT